MKNKSFSNLLILTSAFVTIISSVNPWILIFWMNKDFLVSWNYLLFLIQFLLYQFLHGWLFHILSNSLFIYIFWNQLESFIWNKRYITFFVLNSIFVWIALLFLSTWTTIWISWFAMAILAYITMELKRRKNPEYKSALLFLWINVAIGLTGNISFVWHLFWAIFGIMFYFFNKKSY
ncbi:MAG: hypothetical protein ACD_4C00459G0003 [uncultured bacterium (gcode 4)]|uniref:Peptidase S54 rhomboid domain-containing protein n=1 Tax=uncultured bacterium (gcode 4) TaxID=1234023 RepID=K2G7I8_9BACT|nr:MAG: hypothetical protein ACD_4C00459G0003 [uncultured bacterium (gcode 4)]